MHTWRPVTWGNQEPLVPISTAALRAKPSQRILALSEPKPIYVDEATHLLMSMERSKSAPATSNLRYKDPTPRIIQLAEPKKPLVLEGADKKYQPFTREGARSPLTEEKLIRLSTPSTLNRRFEPDRTNITEVSRAALFGNIPLSVDRLSQPKTHRQDNCRDPVWEISKATKHANPSSRIRELARPKILPEGFQIQKVEPWKPLSRSLRAVCTRRTNELAQPVRRDSMSDCLYDPEAFTVKKTALLGKVPDRIEALAQKA
ncbi:Testicular haploid expressed gene protein-like [Trichoplax sp. H2]|nr:Testicular haploid expressed gene protein-like [Trichoplax sp. H2]|eukprot:RDD43548.1 Testicular haploid expressed gene protein-like [Trichoplax sp. H2]